MCTDSRRAAEAVFDLGCTWTFTQRENDWQADRQAGDGGVKRQGELSLGVSGLLPAGCNIKVQNDAVSRPADRRMRPG